MYTIYEYFFAIDVSLNADNTIVSIVETSECVLNLRIVFASHSYKISFYVFLTIFFSDGGKSEHILSFNFERIASWFGV